MQITMLNNRAEYLIRELKHKCRVIEKDDSFTSIEFIELDHNVILSIFHSGVAFGHDNAFNIIYKNVREIVKY